MEIERLVYECSKNGIERDASGGQIYSYTRGMEKLLENPQLNISRLEDYKEPVDFEPDPEKNIAPLTPTYRQLDTLFPKQFRFMPYTYEAGKLFAFSNNRMSVDWAKYENYSAYLNERENEDNLVGGRTGAHEFYIIAGDLDEITDFPCAYYQSRDVNVPYTAEDFCSGKKPDYMSPLYAISTGNTITKEVIRQFLSDDMERTELLKKMLYCLLRYKKTEDCSYNRNLVICDEHEIIIYWISALSFLFSKDMAKGLSFSTYEYSPIGADYRICGAFPLGTDYRFDDNYKASYVFDLINGRYEDIENVDESGLYGYLVNTFLYAEDVLDKFYKFLEDFDFNEISVELEDAFELYRVLYLEEDKQNITPQQISKAASFAKYCTNDTEIKKTLIHFINLYMTMSSSQKEICGNAVLDLLKHFSGQIPYLEKRCADKLVDMLLPSSTISIDTVKNAYKMYEQLFEEIGGNLFLVYYNDFLQKANTILVRNANAEYNIYIANMIYRHMQENNIDISNMTPFSTEGSMLHVVVENLLMLAPAEITVKDYIHRLTDVYKAHSYAYLYLLMALEGMVRDYAGGSVDGWIRMTESCVNEYIDSETGKSAAEMYKALIELDCENKVLKHIEKRTATSEAFDLLFDDVNSILTEYESKFREMKGVFYELLLNAAVQKSGVQDNLKRILELRVDRKNDTIFLKAANRFTAGMQMALDAVDKTTLDMIIDLYKDNRMKPDAKLTAVKVLKDLEADLEEGKKRIATKYRKVEIDAEKALEFPNVSDDEKIQFFEDYTAMITEVYSLSENIQVIHYYNHVFDFSEVEYASLMEYEIRTFIKENRKADAEFLCELITYAFLQDYQPSVEILADILTSHRVNLNKINRYFNEENKKIIKDIHSKLKFRGTPEQERKDLLTYWNDVFLQASEEGAGVFKIFKSFFKK